MSLRRRLAVSLAVACVVFTVVLWFELWNRPNIGAGDFSLPLCGAARLFNGTDPYSCNTFSSGRYWPSNPLTTILLSAAFLPFDPYAAQFMEATFCGLLALVIALRREYWRLWLLASIPFLHSLYWVQWSPLILAIYFLPDLLPLALVKPQLAISVILTHLNRYRFLGLLVFGVLTLLLDPTWPLRWLPQAGSYDGWIPLLRFPLGPLLLLALLNRKDPRALFFLLFAASPQRGYYDLLMLFAVPHTRRELMLLVAFSWVLLFWPASWFDWRDWSLWFFYLPALAICLFPLYPTMTAKLRASALHFHTDHQPG